MNKLAFKKPQLKSLTGLRFVAAIYIVLFHHGNALCIMGTSVCNSIGYGYVSVSLFFILSGFLLAYVYLDPSNLQPIEKKSFWIARFARIYPLYLLSLVASFPSFASKFEYFSGSDLTTLQGICSGILSLLLLQGWTPWTSTVFNTPTWAVSSEAFLYLIFPFIVISIARLNKHKFIFLLTFLWIITFLPLICFSDLFKSGYFTQFASFNFPHFWFPFIAYSPWSHLPQFAIGICTGILFLRKDEYHLKINSVSIVGLLTFGCLCLSIFGILIIAPNFRYLLLNNGLLAPLFCIVIYYLSAQDSWIARFFSTPKMSILGEASYAMYLFQNPLLSLMQRLPLDFLELQKKFTPLFNLFFLSLYILVLISFSIFVSYTIETPIRKIIINKFNK